MTDLYETLGVEKDATSEEIKAAHRAAAKKHHPDVNPDGDPSVFLGIQKAYEVLIDQDERDFYDRTGQEDRRRVVSKGELRASEAFIQALAEDEKDPHSASVKSVKRDIASFNKTLQQLRKFRDKFSKALTKLSKKGGGDSVIHDRLKDEIENCETTIKDNETNIAICNTALTVLGDYSFEIELSKAEADMDIVAAVNKRRRGGFDAPTTTAELEKMLRENGLL